MFKLKLQDYIIIRFDFLQANCGKLVKPNVPPNHNWSGDKVQKLAGQGDIYIRPTYLEGIHIDVHSEAQVHASFQVSYIIIIAT